ncbi:hypothetical protein J1N35_029214 [Gossypium stocksii]|uniref:Reverse transcriptase domain-containing protein n=1 Tax=Gossypium stocksii TaxID=47602 RepID=A0A9D3UYG2_9ROSI|nr:hypothetical protein J1N35_029214 [Gossypium stocksii]
MSPILDCCIDESQGTFIPGRHIFDNTLIAYEVLYSLKLKKKCKNGNFALKLDLSKVYDRVEWDFFAGMMDRMGFHQNWIVLIMRCVCSVSYMVGINDVLSDCFTLSRGLRQGDPLTLYLFLLCTEDDSIIFGDASIERAHVVKKILMEYEAVSGQQINFDKSIFYFGSCVGIEAIPVYVMQCFALPKALCHTFEGIMNKFWWSHGKSAKGIHWSSWSALCLPKVDGGMGFRDLHSFNKALLAKNV